MRRTSAWPLALVFVALVVYASLYPFIGWRDQGLSPWFVFVESRIPRGTLFDWGVNVVGYMPLGFLLCLGWLRTWSSGWGLLWATLIGGALSALMETLQIYLPIRVPSALDIGLNLAGSALGALLAWGLERLGALTRWSQFRAHWFVPEASGALVLLALWPVALLFPTPVPLGLGQALEPLTDWAHNLQLRLELVNSSPLVPAVRPALSANGVGLGVVLGVLMPSLLVYAVSPQALRRVVLVGLGWGLGLGVTGVSTVFSYGPLHAWGWLTAPVQIGLGVGLLLALAAVRLSMRVCVGLLLLVLGLQLSLLNSVSPGPYLDQTLQMWEQGRLIHFYGLAQWLGWLWPCAALVYGGLRLMGLWAKPKIGP